MKRTIEEYMNMKNISVNKKHDIIDMFHFIRCIVDNEITGVKGYYEDKLSIEICDKILSESFDIEYDEISDMDKFDLILTEKVLLTKERLNKIKYLIAIEMLRK